MAYISADDVKTIRVALKEEFGKTYKFGVKRDNHSGVRITFKSGPAFEVTKRFDRYTHEEVDVDINNHAQINHYHTHMYGEANQKILDKVSEIAHTALGLLVVKVIIAMTIFKLIILTLLTLLAPNVGAWDKP